MFGLFIAIDLKASKWLPRSLKKMIPFIYIYNLLARSSFPLLIGFCQYEPNVLKLDAAAHNYSRRDRTHLRCDCGCPSQALVQTDAGRARIAIDCRCSQEIIPRNWEQCQ